MGFLDKLREMTQPYDDDEDFIDDLDNEGSSTPEPAAAPSVSSTRERRASTAGYSSYDRQQTQPRSQTASTPIRSTRNENKVVNIGGGQLAQVVLCKPERFEQASEIADYLREKKTVLVNLEQTEKDTARRVLDFLSGSAYALSGKVTRIAANTYVATPSGVELIGDTLDALEGTSMYF